MDITREWESLVQSGSKIIYLVLDGASGIAYPNSHMTALEAAMTPHLDRLAADSSTGLLETVGPGITPGSGPGHLALFGYDPFHYRIGRGVLSALGIDFPIREGDVAARINFARVDEQGCVQDRRAGRLATEINQRLCRKLVDRVHLDFDGEFFVETVSEHRAVLVLRGGGLGGQVSDTDPQKTGVRPQAPEALNPESEKTVELVRSFLSQAQRVLEDEVANALLLRGFQKHVALPSLESRFGLRGFCLAHYPMYRGVSRLLGMELAAPPKDSEEMLDVLESKFTEDYGFYFLHLKATDKKGEDGDFLGKVKAIEGVDRIISRLRRLNAVLVVTSDHSTPAAMAAHSWHPVPVIIHGRWCRVDRVNRFDELSCANGILGRRPGLHLMGLALANAGRLRKFGA